MSNAEKLCGALGEHAGAPRTSRIMSNKTRWLFVIYLALAGSYCGLEIDTFLGDTPFFRIGTLLLFCSVLCVMLVPPIVCALFASIRCVWTNRVFRSILQVLNALYLLFAIFLAVYKSARKIDFDFYFLWYNTADTLPALSKLYAPWFPAVILFIAVFALLQKPAFSPLVKSLARAPRKGWTILLALFFFSFLCQLAMIHRIHGSAAGFLYASFFQRPSAPERLS